MWNYGNKIVPKHDESSAAEALEWSSRRPARLNTVVCNIVGGFFLIRKEMVLMFQKLAS